MNKQFLLLILVIIVSGSFCFWNSQQTEEDNITPLPFNENLSCEAMYDEIENDIDNANYCENDFDCDILMLGGWYIDFGCYHFINKAVDKDQFYKKMDVYKEKCSQIINECASTPNAYCISNKCI